MEVYIIRHGETDWNKQCLLQGQSDIPLNDYGRELAKQTAEGLKEIPFDRIYSSPLIRAYETAEIIRGNRDIEIITDERIKEIAFGVDEGVHKDKVSENFKDFFAAPEKYIPPAGGESYQSLLKRAADFVDNELVPLSATATRVMIVAHGALNSALAVYLKGLGVENMWERFIPNCGVNIYEVNGNDFTLIAEGKVYYESDSR